MLSRAFLADTFALVTFFTATGVLNERFVVGMSWVLGRFASARALSRLLWDSLALLLFQVPIYVAIIAAGGARGSALLAGAARAALIMLACERSFGLWLETVRRWMGVPAKGGMTPVSLGS
ncbi:MAG: L-alanine exporter AlaE [Pseudomonadota bacterium]